MYSEVGYFGMAAGVQQWSGFTPLRVNSPVYIGQLALGLFARVEMKILHIITGLDDGGAEAVLFRLCTHDQSNQHTVLSLMNEGKYGPLLRGQGIVVDCLGLPRGRVSTKALVQLWAFIRRHKPEVVQTWMYHANLLGGVVSRLAGVRHICWGIHHSNLEAGSSKQSTIMVARLCAKLSRWIPDRIVCCAQMAVKVHRALGYAPSKFVTIPNGYDLAQFKSARRCGLRLRDEWGIAPTISLLGMVGRFDPHKDHENLLKALALLRQRGIEYRCVLVGSGLVSGNDELAGWLQRHGLLNRVLLLGRRDDIPAVMNALDLHVLSSYGEAFPNVLAEAMACGTPCVTTDVGDAATIVGETGWVVPPRNPHALASAVEQALNARRDLSQWQARQQSARDRVADSFSIERMVSAYRQVWLEATIKA